MELSDLFKTLWYIFKIIGRVILTIIILQHLPDWVQTWMVVLWWLTF